MPRLKTAPKISISNDHSRPKDLGGDNSYFASYYEPIDDNILPPGYADKYIQGWLEQGNILANSQIVHSTHIESKKLDALVVSPRHSFVDFESDFFKQVLGELDDYARANPGHPVSGKFRELFSYTAESDLNGIIALPAKAPVIWKDRTDRNQTPAQFIKENYQPWIGKGLLRSHLLELDKTLYKALSDWLNEPDKNNKLDFELPSRKERTDTWLLRVSEDDVFHENTKAGQRYLAAKARRTTEK